MCVGSPDLGYQYSQELFDRCRQALIVIFGSYCRILVMA